MNEDLKKAIKKLIYSAIIIGLIILIIYIILDKFGLTDISQETLQNYINSTNGLAPIIYILISFLQVTFVPIPGSITILAGNYLFGPFKAFLYSYIGMMIGSILAFYLGRVIGKRFVYWVAGDKDKVEEYLRKVKGKETVVLFFMFLFPFFPDDMLCCLAGITSISWTCFIIMQLVTRVTSIAATLFFMSGEIIPYHGWGIPVLILVGILGIVAFIYSYKNADKIQEWFVNLFKNKKKTRN